MPKVTQTSPVTAKIVDRKTLVEIFRRFEEQNPHPKSELEYTTPFTLLVAVALSAQATDTGVNKATRKLFALADTPHKMLELGEAGVRDCIRTINYFNTKAKNIIALSQKLIDDFKGDVPKDIDALQTLPGVGKKTASVVMNVAFGVPRLAVDTHIFRVANRIALVHSKNPLATQEPLEKLIPKEYLLHAHHWLILHGRYICKARKPDCTRCLINDLCQYPAKEN